MWIDSEFQLNAMGELCPGKKRGRGKAGGIMEKGYSDLKLVIDPNNGNLSDRQKVVLYDTARGIVTVTEYKLANLLLYVFHCLAFSSFLNSTNLSLVLSY